jgi:Sel1 repeat
MIGNFMKRTTLAIVSLSLLIGVGHAAAQPVSDRDMANRYFQSAQAGDDNAQFYLAALYSAGVGEPRSDEEAAHWLTRAASQGHSHAMLILSGLYATGRGVKKDNVQAYKWAYLVNAGSKIDEYRNDSRQLIGQLEAKMTPAEISQAKSDAYKFHAVSGKAAAPTAPAEDLTRAAPSQPAGAATPTPTPATSAPLPAKASDNSDEPSRVVRRPNVEEQVLDHVPHNLRKRYGF